MFTSTRTPRRNNSILENMSFIGLHVIRRSASFRFSLGFVLGALLTFVVSRRNSQINHPSFRFDQSKFEYEKNNLLKQPIELNVASIWNESWDGIGTSSMATRNFFFIRHGRYFDQAYSADQMKLNKLGQEQLVHTGRRLNSLNIKFDRLIHSNMIRARESAEIINTVLDRKLQLIEDELLAEGLPVAPIPYAGISQREVDATGERQRIDQAFNRYFHRAPQNQTRDTNDIIVFHGNIMRYFICKIMQYPVESWLRITVNHGSITQISILGDGKVMLKSIGDSGFIPAEKVTF